MRSKIDFTRSFGRSAIFIFSFFQFLCQGKRSIHVDSACSMYVCLFCLAIYILFDASFVEFFGTDMASGAMICGVLFSISSVADDMMTPKFFHVAFFYSGLTIQLYTNCLYGNEVFISVNNFSKSFAIHCDSLEFRTE